ncbi:hypothetical protein JCM18899A_00120 [Nocardioides sp. AN3]
MVDGMPCGLAVNALTSVSLDPAVILFCVAKAARTHDRLHVSRHAAVNILSHGQARIARRFATSGGDKFTSCDWRPGPHGSPVIEGVSAWLEVEIRSRTDAVTHTIFTGGVLAAEAAVVPPLVYLSPGLFDGAQMVEATK